MSFERCERGVSHFFSLLFEGVNILRGPGFHLVAAGFQPAFKFKQKIVLVVERGLEARAYAFDPGFLAQIS